MIENSIEKLSEDNMYSISSISLDKYYQVGQDIRFSFEKFTLFSTTKIFDNKSEIKKIEHKEEKNNDETFFSIRNYDDKGNIIYEKKEKVYFDKGNESKNYGEGKAKRIEEKYDGSKLVSKEISYVTPNEEIREIYNEEGLIEKRVRSLKEDWTKIYNGKNELVKIIYIYIGDRLGEFKTIVEEYSNNKLVKKTIDFEDFDGEIIEIYDENDKLVYREYTGGNKGKEIFYDKNGNIIKTEWSNNGHDEERGYKKYY